LLIHLQSLGFQNLKDPPLGLGIIRINSAKLPGYTVGFDTFTNNHFKVTFAFFTTGELGLAITRKR
jgi:hypothetical protein